MCVCLHSLCRSKLSRLLCVIGEFWLGLKKIHSLAAQGDSLLHIQLEDWKQSKRFIEYHFTLGGPETHYIIHLTQASGDLPDAMSNHTGMMFSTEDRDNDNHKDFNCAYNYTGIIHQWKLMGGTAIINISFHTEHGLPYG